jgi:hypothetical protein
MSRSRLLLLGLLAALAVSAGTSASASAVTMLWIKGGVPLKEGEKVEAKSHGGPFTLKGTIAGTAVEVKCAKETGEGWVENPGGEKNGTGFIKMSLTACTVLKPAGQGCKAKEPLVLEATLEPFLKAGQPGIIFVRFSVVVGKASLGELTLTGCSNGALNGAFPLTGTLGAKSKNGEEEGSFEFTSESGSELKFAGNVAKFTGTSILEF